MKTKRNKKNKKKRGGKTGKKWVSAFSSAQKTLNKSGSYLEARKTLKKKAVSNIAKAKNLFGSINTL
jgi:hypothetical protein